MKALLHFACLLSTALAQVDLSSYPLSAVLRDRDGEVYTLHWGFDVEAETIRFAVNVSTSGWVGLGLSPTGGMANSDVVIGWVNEQGQAFFHDRFATGESRPPVDAQQNWFLDGGMEMDGFTILAFRRGWVTCDQFDRDIKLETARVIYSWNNADPAGDDPNAVMYHGVQQRGTLSLSLIGQSTDPPPDPADVRVVDVTVDNVHLPSVTTTYWCSVFEYPPEVQQQKHYITKISPSITPGNEAYVHHIIVYECASLNSTHARESGVCVGEVSDTVNDCRGSGTTIAGWAVGAGERTYPEGVAYPIGGGVGPRYILMETHYDNPQNRDDIIDSSGILFSYTAIAPRFEAGTLPVGYIVSPFMVIPPNTASYKVIGDCNTRCTGDYIPEDGITVFSNLFHTHLAGTGITLRHYRPKSDKCNSIEELPPIEQNLQYDFNYQQSTLLPTPIKVLPGDILQVECIYQTLNRDGVVLGGPATQDEMCLSFVSYYPRIPLAACITLPNAFTPQYLSDFKATLPSDVQGNITEVIASLRAQSMTGGGNFNRDKISSVWNDVEWSSEAIASFERQHINGPVIDVCIREGFSEDPLNSIQFSPHNGVTQPDCEYQAPNKCTLGSGAREVVLSTGVILISIALYFF